MRKQTENGNFDRPCFVQTVYFRTLLVENYKKYRIVYFEVGSSRGMLQQRVY